MRGHKADIINALTNVRFERNRGHDADLSVGPSLVGSVDVARQLTTHIEFENTGNHDNGLRPISVLEHCKPERLSTIDEESAAEAARVPNNPVSSAVLANEKQRRPRTRGRLDLFHAILRDLTQ